MQRNMTESPAIKFADDLFGPSSKGKSYYEVSIHRVIGLVITYHAVSPGKPERQHTILPKYILDKDGVLAAVRKKNYRNTAQIHSTEKASLRKLIQNFHETLVSTAACADVTVNIFREFYNLDEKSARIIRDTALTCIEATCKTIREPIKDKIRHEFIEYYFVYLRRYLAATAPISRNFTDILRFKLVSDTVVDSETAQQIEVNAMRFGPSDFINEDSSVPSIGLHSVKILELVNETVLLNLAHSFCDVLPPNMSPCDDGLIKDGLISALEKMLLPALIAACKMLPEDAYWNVDFIPNLPDTMQIKIARKYATAPVTIDRAILAVLNMLEKHFYRTLGYKMGVKPSDLNHDSFNISRIEISLASSPSPFFHHAQTPAPAAAAKQPAHPSILRKSS